MNSLGDSKTKSYRGPLALLLTLVVLFGGGTGVVGTAVLAVITGANLNSSSGCTRAGDTSAGGPKPDASTDIGQQQLDNARTIDQAAQAHGLSGQASLVAIVAAVGESDLINLDQGDRDSVGVFQQRPSMGWQNPRDVYFAAESFLLGQQHQGPGGLVAVSGWEQMPITLAIHAVQANADPQHYARFEQRGRDFALAAGVDLNRAATTEYNADPPDSSALAAMASNPCAADTGKGGPPGALPDVSGPCPLDIPSKVSCNVAIAFAQQQIDTGDHSWHNWCLRFVSTAYGQTFAGYDTAYLAAKAIEDAGGMHPSSTPSGAIAWESIPRGAVLWWDGSAVGNPAGHVAIYAGNGWVYSSDAPNNDGAIGLVPTTVLDSWGQRFMGYSAAAVSYA